jgi:hypothetical protein
MKLTPHEQARLEVWLAVQEVCHNGYNNTSGHTPDEIGELELHLEKQKWRVYHLLCMDKIFEKKLDT